MLVDYGRSNFAFTFSAISVYGKLIPCRLQKTLLMIMQSALSG